MDLCLKAITLLEEENGLIDKVKMDLSAQEEKLLRKLLTMQEIPSPKLLIKYHKTINKKG